MNNYVLITGASKGLGLEFAKLFAKDGYPLIIVARSHNLLEEIKKDLITTYGVQVVVIEKDLTKINAATELYYEVKSQNLRVDYLVNNAGFGDYGEFLDGDITKYENMINLNIMTLMKLCYLFGNDMRENKYGKIMNVASIASFFAGPFMATYYATKAFVLSFSEAISKEFASYGITVTALCPGTTATHFFDNANATSDKTNLLKNMHPAPAYDVAKYGYQKMMKGKVVAIAGTKNRLAIFMNRFISRKLSRHIVYNIQRKRRN